MLKPSNKKYKFNICQLPRKSSHSLISIPKSRAKKVNLIDQNKETNKERKISAINPAIDQTRWDKMVIELAQDELKNLTKVWLSTFVSLSYCYFIGKITQKGFTRLITILPVIFLFLILPINLTSIHLCGFSAFFISWLANFKLLLFAFGKPPLCVDPPISFPLFVTIACLPIKISPQQDENSQNSSYIYTKNSQKSQNNSYPYIKNSQKSQNEKNPDHKSQNKSHPSSQNSQKSLWNYLIKLTLLAIMIKVYDYSDHIPPKVLWLIYFMHIYIAIEMFLAIIAKLAKFSLGVELEPTFNEPLLSTSLQDFWGKRWNLMVTSILRPTVYLPTRDYFTKIFGRETASLPAVMATFVVSAIMHESIYYYIGRVRPTLQVTWFFLLHGVCLCVEIVVKKYGRERKWWVPPRWLSGGATAAFVVGTGFWLFLPPLLKAGLVERGLGEYTVVGAFVTRVVG